MIEIAGLEKRFGKLKAVNNLNLSLSKGECIALIGPNGCGKTTMIKCILGMVIPQKGTVNFNGKNIAGQYKYRSMIGYMPQIGRYPDNMTIGQVIDTIKGLRHEAGEHDRELYDAFQIDSIKDKRMSTLSGGTRQKVSAVLAFMWSPEVLILDEPTAGLDPIASEILKEKIAKEKAKGRLILITSHILSELDGLVSEVIFMQDGELKFHSKIDEIKRSTGENTLAKAISGLLKKEAA